jgi:hypothetical protein
MPGPHLRHLDFIVSMTDAESHRPAFDVVLSRYLHEWASSSQLRQLRTLQVEVPNDEMARILVNACCNTVETMKVTWWNPSSSSANSLPERLGLPHGQVMPWLTELHLTNLQRMEVQDLANFLDALVPRCGQVDQLSVEISGEWHQAGDIEGDLGLNSQESESVWNMIDNVLADCAFVTINIEGWADNGRLDVPLPSSSALESLLPTCDDNGILCVELEYKIHQSSLNIEDGYTEEMLSFTPRNHRRIVQSTS